MFIDRCFAEPVRLEISADTFSRSDSSESEFGRRGSSGYLGGMSSAMLRSRSQSLLPITQPTLKSPNSSFIGGRRPSRSRRCYRPLLALLAVIALFAGAYQYTRPSLAMAGGAGADLPGGDGGAAGYEGEAAHRRRGSVVDDPQLDAYNSQQAALEGGPHHHRVAREEEGGAEHLGHGGAGHQVQHDGHHNHQQQQQRRQQAQAAAAAEARERQRLHMEQQALAQQQAREGVHAEDDVLFHAGALVSGEQQAQHHQHHQQAQHGGASEEDAMRLQQQHLQQQEQAAAAAVLQQQQQQYHDAQQYHEQAALHAQQEQLQQHGGHEQQQQQQYDLGEGQQQQQQEQQQQHAQHGAGEVPPPRAPPSLYDSGLSAVDIRGNVVHLADLRGRAALLVNVASHCGYTESNYRGLQTIYERYHAYGLEILAFPCNQFGQQEPGSHEEIEAFVESNYQAKFPLMSKVEVNGPQAHPVFAFLKEHTAPLPGHPANEDLNWNFNKFLVDKWGHPVKRYGPDFIQYELETDIYNELVKPYPDPAAAAATTAEAK